MHKILFPVLILAALCWNACGCPPDEKTGTLNLTAAAQAFLPYQGSETLRFTDETGAELILQAPRGQELKTDQLCYRTTCTEAKFDTPSSCEYYDADSRRYTFFGAENTVVIDLLVYSEVYRRGMPDFYDALQVGFAFGAPSIVGQHIIEARFAEPLDTTKLGISDFFQERPTLVLNGQTFSNVLAYEEGPLGIYIEQRTGIIGFRNTEHTWVVQP
jgi:hypothetical protein